MDVSSRRTSVQLASRLGSKGRVSGKDQLEKKIRKTRWAGHTIRATREPTGIEGPWIKQGSIRKEDKKDEMGGTYHMWDTNTQGNQTWRTRGCEGLKKVVQVTIRMMSSRDGNGESLV